MQPTQPCPDLPDRCELQHKVFTCFGDVRFRKSTTDGLAVMALRLGDQEAQLPLDSLRREFSIGKETADGRMLDLIGSALDYVSFLQQGDRLPSEIRTGEASWQPSPSHLRLAATRLQVDFCSWIMPGGSWAQSGRDDLTVLRIAGDPALRDEVRAAAEQASARLGVGGHVQVLSLLAELARELSYIEALRERLLEPVRSLCRRTRGMVRSGKRKVMSSDTLSQVHRLMVIALKQVAERFEDVDAQTADIADMLREADSVRRVIRTNRDWLYRSQRAWDPILESWRQFEDTASEDSGALFGEHLPLPSPPVHADDHLASPRSRPRPPRPPRWRGEAQTYPTLSLGRGLGKRA